ncbi:hypothetical protein B0H15DRAFT_609822 [Mycena belliarum]|uniref:Uncharacterized protein n=1 Tax=Mycena belliarum TaxID=1033014 RepID=A0AAD6TQ65_9AGAR|nr:hypothetical protein B0H15DRAFT_609822 [Mycena belliae]
MVASSLANWDGSLSPAKSPSAPLSSQTGTLMNGTLVNSSSAHALPARISHPSSEQGTSRHSQVTPDTKATYPSPVASSPMPESSLGPVSPRVPSKTTYSSPVASSSMPESSLGHASPRVTSQTTYESPVASSSMSVSPPAPTSLSPLQKQQTSPSPAPAHLVRTSVPHVGHSHNLLAGGLTGMTQPPPPLPFGPPRDILTTPTSSSASGPPWLNHSPSPKDGLISLDIQATSLANYKAGRTAPVQRAHTIPSSATHAPPVSVLSSAHSLPSLLGGRTSTIANALAPSASFGRPGPALGASASGARAPPVFGPGAALTSPAAGQATQDSTSAMGKSPTSAPQPASIPPKRSPGASESPLSSLSASPASSPAARGAWWGNGYVVGSVYVDAGTVNLVPQVVTDWSKAKAGSKTSGGKMSDAAGTKDRHRKDEEGGESLGAEARVRSAVTVTYESKAKAKAREQEVAERGRSAASSQSVYESGHGRSVSASGSGTIHQGSKSQLFIASPEISKAPTPHQLFTPSPGRLFTPTPERSVSPVRRHVPPGVGIARKVSKRKREVMDYVLVPPMPYKRARTDHMDKQRGAGATARTGRRESRRAESWETRGTSRGRGTGRRMERSASTHGERRWESENSRSRSRSRSPRPRKIRAPSRVARETHDSVGDALNYAWNHNAGSGTIPVGGAAGRGTVRVRRKRDRAREENWEDDDKGTRKRVKSDLPSDGQSSREDEVPESKQAFRWRKFAWCREEADKIFMHFDLPVEMADRAAYAALRLPDGAKTIALARPCDRPVPCLVPPVLQQEQDADGLWAGGVILGDGGSESKEDRRYRAPKVKEGLGEVSRGRTTQREEQLLESKIVTKPKTKPTPRALAGPSKVHVRAVTPISSLAPVRTLSLLPSSSPSTFYRPPLENVPPVSLATSPDLLASPSTLLWTDAPLPAPPPSRAVDTPKEAPPPLSMSVKAKGKQKMQSPSTNIVRTPSPRGDKGASQWAPRRSASRSHRSASRGRRSKSRGRSLALRPMAEPSMSAYFHGLDPSPPGLQSSPRGLRFSPAAPLTTPVFALSAQFDYAPDETHLQLANAGPSFYLPPENHQYGDGTIDPSLLGGGVMDLDGGDYYDQAQETYSPTHSVVSLPSPGPSISPLGLRLSSRRPVQRRIPDDMMPTDIYESTISSASSSADFNDIAFVPPSPKSKPKNAKPRRQGKGGQTKRSSVASR